MSGKRSTQTHICVLTCKCEWDITPLLTHMSYVCLPFIDIMCLSHVVAHYILETLSDLPYFIYICTQVDCSALEWSCCTLGKFDNGCRDYQDCFINKTCWEVLHMWSWGHLLGQFDWLSSVKLLLVGVILVLVCSFQSRVEDKISAG